MEIKKIEIGGNEYEVEYAETFFQQALGMRGRKEGKMLFRFPSERRWRIDMAMVLSDLHLYFVDHDMRVVDIRKAPRWGLNPLSWAPIRPSEPAKYLLESSKPLPVTEGDELEIEDEY